MIAEAVDTWQGSGRDYIIVLIAVLWPVLYIMWALRRRK